MQNPGVDSYSKALHGPRVDSIVGTKLVNSSFWGDGIPEVKLPNSSQTSIDENDKEEGIFFCTNLLTIVIVSDKLVPFVELLIVPPRFSRGLIFEADGRTVKSDISNYEKTWKLSDGEQKKTIDLKLLIEQEQSSLCKQAY